MNINFFSTFTCLLYQCLLDLGISRNLLNLQKANKNSLVFYKNIFNPESWKIV